MLELVKNEERDALNVYFIFIIMKFDDLMREKILCSYYIRPKFQGTQD